MIKENLNIKFTAGETSSEYEGQIIVPSQVITATKQNEEVNLEKSPNVTIKLKGEAARGVKNLSSQYKKIKAEFELENKTYTMNVSIIGSTNDYVVLQYCDGLTAEEASNVLTMKWAHIGMGPALLIKIDEYQNVEPFNADSPGGVSLRFFDEKNNDVTENIVNNNTINVSFEGYEGSIFNGQTIWVDQRADCIEAGSVGVDYFLQIRFADQQEMIAYRDAYNRENGNSENYDGLITKCNVSVEGYDISPSSFSISGWGI